MSASDATEPEVAQEDEERTFDRLVDEGEQRLGRSWPGLVATGLLGGLDIGVGVLALLLVEHETGSVLLGGLAFAIGFIALTLARSELFTEDFLVPVAAGKARALEMALLGDPIPAEKALEWGLVNRVVPAGQLMEEARKLTERLAKGPTRSYAQSKRALNNSFLKIMDEQLDLEADIQAEMVTSSDFIEGVTAFVEKRDPRFTGN